MPRPTPWTAKRLTTFAESVVLHLVEQRLVADLQFLGRLFPIPTGLLEHALDHTFLRNLCGTPRDRLEIYRFALGEIDAEGAEIERRVRRGGPGSVGASPRRDLLEHRGLVSEHHHAPHHVLQLAH